MTDTRTLQEISRAVESGDESLLRRIARSVSPMDGQAALSSLELLPNVAAGPSDFPKKPRSAKVDPAWWM